MKPEATYIYENDKTYIMVEGSIIGAVDDDALIEEEAEKIVNESATHVTTPNGLRGKILGRVAGLWNDQVTVRFENGRIVQLPVSSLSFEHDASTSTNSDPIDSLSARLSSKFANDIDSLKKRSGDLNKLRAEAREIINDKRLSTEDLSRIGDILAQINYEQNEVAEAINAYKASMAENFKAVAPYRVKAYEQGGPSRGDSGWLHTAVEEIQNEVDATDYEKLMDEGPEAFVATIDQGMLADSGAVRSAATGYIRTLTSSFDDDLTNKYERVWIERVETLRRKALSEYKEVNRKEAKAQDEHITNLPDDAIFL